MTQQRQILQQKAKEIKEIEDIIQQYKVIALANLQKVRAAQLQELRKKLQRDAYLRVIKNTLMKRAIAQSKDKPNLDELEGQLTGSTIYLFTNLNPFKLVLLLEKSKVKTTAKSGDVAAFDVIVPAGNTGQPPGPIISQLGAVGLKTRIESGSVSTAWKRIKYDVGDSCGRMPATSLYDTIAGMRNPRYHTIHVIDIIIRF